MSADNSPDGKRTFRSPSGLIALVAGVLFAAFLLGDAVVRAGWGAMFLLAPWVLLGLWVLYLTCVASTLRVDDDGVVVHNYLRRTSFGWRRVRDIDFRWQVVFSLDDGRELASLGGPAHARQRRRPMSDGESAPAPAGFRVLTDLRDRWQSATGTADAPIRRTWDIPSIVALIVIVCWAIAAVVLTR